MAINKKKIIACQVFTDELSAVLPEEYGDIEITWLDAGLHWNFDKFGNTLKQALKGAEREEVDARFLFGSGCHLDMFNLINSHGGKILGPKK